MRDATASASIDSHTAGAKQEAVKTKAKVKGKASVDNVGATPFTDEQDQESKKIVEKAIKSALTAVKGQVNYGLCVRSPQVRQDGIKREFDYEVFSYANSQKEANVGSEATHNDLAEPNVLVDVSNGIRKGAEKSNVLGLSDALDNASVIGTTSTFSPTATPSISLSPSFQPSDSPSISLQPTKFPTSSPTHSRKL